MAFPTIGYLKHLQCSQVYLSHIFPTLIATGFQRTLECLPLLS